MLLREFPSPCRFNHVSHHQGHQRVSQLVYTHSCYTASLQTGSSKLCKSQQQLLHFTGESSPPVPLQEGLHIAAQQHFKPDFTDPFFPSQSN